MHVDSYVDAWDKALKRLQGIGLERRRFDHKSLFWQIVYTTETTFLEINVDLREHSQILDIYPRRSLTGHPDTFNQLYLSCPFYMILSIRAPDLRMSWKLPPQPESGEITKELFDSIVLIGTALYDYAADIFSGDFSIYPKITALEEEG